MLQNNWKVGLIFIYLKLSIGFLRNRRLEEVNYLNLYMSEPIEIHSVVPLLRLLTASCHIYCHDKIISASSFMRCIVTQ